MRYIVTVVAALILSTTCHAQGRSIFIHNGGTHSCGKYLAAVQGHPPGAGMMRGQFSDDHFLYMAWLGGFFSAMNVWMMDERNEIKSDNAAIDVWIRKWCEQNSTKQLVDAAWAFAWDQRPEYLQAYFARRAR